MDAKTRALEIFNNLNRCRLEDGQTEIRTMYIALHSNGTDIEDWYVDEKYAHAADRAPRNEDDGIIPALEDFLEMGMAMDDSVQGEILTIRNVYGIVTVRQNVLILRPKE